MSDRARVFPISELPPGGSVKVEAFGTEVAIFNVDGALFAVANACPHYGGPLCHGRVSGTRLAGAPFEHRYGRDGRILTCPWHGWEFDLETGRALFDKTVRLRSFAVTIDDGTVVLRRRRGQASDRSAGQQQSI